MKRAKVSNPFEAGRQVAAMISDARFVPLESKNHILLPHEKAWSVFRKELDDFVDADKPVETQQRTASCPI